MKPVFICHPLGGEKIRENIEKVKQICKELVSEEIMPFGPHIYFTQFLNDDKELERAIGIKCGLFMLKNFIKNNGGEMWVYGNRISKGMIEELKFCKKENIPVVYKNLALKKEIEKIMG